jgi:transcriptional regulator with XRE-family HTH domain
MSSIAERLRSIRGQQAQKEFASIIGLKQTTYGKYERGVTSPSMDTASLICQKLGLNPRWLILGEEPMYDAEASQERPHIKSGDLKNKSLDELPADTQKGIKMTLEGALAWRQRWDELPEWAKEEIEKLYQQIEELRIDRDELVESLLKAKDEAINAQNMALQTMSERASAIADHVVNALAESGHTWTNEELFQAAKSCNSADELAAFLKRGRSK